MDVTICEIITRLDEILSELEDFNLDDELHVALELGQQFREELSVHCEE